MAMQYDLPRSFISDHAVLSWRDMLYGLERRLISVSTIQEIAIDRVTDESGPGSPEVRLASLKRGDLSEVGSILNAVAKGENTDSDDETARKWCFLVMQWLYEHREQVGDPSGEVEAVYGDFGYPSEVAPFVGYESSFPPRANEPADPETRLMARWARYLAERQKEFGPDKGGV
jgi:hypothetical protein